MSTTHNAPYILKYRQPGKRPNTTRWAMRPVEDMQAAVDWMKAHSEEAFLPAFVETKGWKPHTVAILG